MTSGCSAAQARRSSAPELTRCQPRATRAARLMGRHGGCRRHPGQSYARTRTAIVPRSRDRSGSLRADTAKSISVELLAVRKTPYRWTVRGLRSSEVSSCETDLTRGKRPAHLGRPELGLPLDLSPDSVALRQCWTTSSAGQADTPLIASEGLGRTPGRRSGAKGSPSGSRQLRIPGDRFRPGLSPYQCCQ